jgi:hypothetical protein
MRVDLRHPTTRGATQLGRRYAVVPGGGAGQSEAPRLNTPFASPANVAAGRPRCVNPGCGNLAARRKRGLCWSCHRSPRVRHRFPLRPSGYPVKTATGGGLTGQRPLPATATSALPGTEAKILVLQARAARRQQLHHPDDARLEPALAGFARALRALASDQRQPLPVAAVEARHLKPRAPRGRAVLGHDIVSA